MYDPFDTHRPREVRPGEYPAWDEALAVVNRDLAAQLPKSGPLRLVAQPAWPEEEGDPVEYVHVALPDGSWHGDIVDHGAPATPADALIAVAEAAQETVLACLWQVWPVCLWHRLGMHPGQEEDRPVWWCAGGGTAQDPEHVGAAMGGVEAPYRPRGERRTERNRTRRSRGDG